MTDLESGLQAIVDHLQNCQEDSGHAFEGLMPGVETVLLSDQITTDKQQPAITVDWTGEDLGQSGFGMAGGPSRDEIEVCLYVGSLPKGDVPSARLRAIYSSESGTKGLRHALRSFPGGSGFALTLLSARTMRPEERPHLRFTRGLLCRCSVRQIGRR